ncbi:MAG TPA: pyridoxal-dependent decarboxylase, partial [Gemmatimonadales bacterium]|nr:pyridoxal-dependent decarboxylase [Gemmatimonadales bacterium]
INPAEALPSWFLGPRAENAELLERLVVESLRDHVFWRRNYHPEDGFTIREIEKRREGFEESVATLTQELMGLLAELKRDVPFFSGRYKGHMVAEQTIASQIGWFATMLYNPNNIAVEISPVTTRLELEVAGQLAAMIGYDPTRSWGHLTGGGTIANFEALWLARSVRYLPVAAAGAAEELGLELEVRLPAGGTALLQSLPLWELLNITNAATLDLWDLLWASAPAADVRRALANHSLATIGYQEYSRRLALSYGDPLPAGVVLVAATAHYSWEKIVRALGIGSNQLGFIPLDHCYRMDPDALWRRLRELARRRQPVQALVSVCGTTEESAVDRLDQVLEVRARAERELGMAFHVHSDACYGGYAAAVTRRPDGSRRTVDEIRASAGCDWPDQGWLRAMSALGEADSVTVDPHKMGYVPYAAGAILVRDGRTRHLVATDPPYLSPADAPPSGTERFLGRYILEGSKPGAAAAAVWLSHKVLPLDARGYGYLIERTVAGARRFHAALASADLDGFRTVMLPRPDINIVCWVMTHPALETIEAVNRLNERVYTRMSLARPDGAPEYIITRTRLRAPMYEGAIDPVLHDLGVGSVEEWRAGGAAGLVVLRSTIMEPFLAAPGGPDHVSGFVAALRRACREALDEDDGVGVRPRGRSTDVATGADLGGGDI